MDTPPLPAVTETWARGRRVVLEPITPLTVPFVRGLLERNAGVFDFLERINYEAQTDAESNFVALAHGFRVGFGRLWWHAKFEILIGSYAVQEGERRRGYGLEILRELHAIARDRGRPFGCAVLETNAASVRLCTRHFGDALYRAEALNGAGLVVIFGDLAAAAALLVDD